MHPVGGRLEPGSPVYTEDSPKMVNSRASFLFPMGRLRVPPLTVSLLVALIFATTAFAGCLGSPSDDVDLDALPSEDEAAHDPAGEEGLYDESAPQKSPTVGLDPENITDEYTNEEEPTTENTSDRSSYVGPPVARLRLMGANGAPTTNITTPAPYNAPIHLDGYLSGGAIPYWTLHLDDELLSDGQKLPTQIEHQIVTPGNHTLTLQVYDGRTVEYEQVHLEIQRPEPPPAIHFNGTITGAWAPEQGYVGEQNAHTFHLEVPVTQISANLTGDATALDLDLELIAPDGTTAARHVHFNEPTGTLFPAQEDPIVVVDPDYTTQLGEWTLHVKPAASISGDYSLNIEFE